MADATVATSPVPGVLTWWQRCAPSRPSGTPAWWTQPAAHPWSANGWTTGWTTSRPAGSARGRWRAIAARCGCTFRPGVGHHRLDRLQPEHLERLYAALAEKGLSPASILRAHRVLSRAVRVASQRGKVARNVATLVDPPAVKRPQRALPLSAAEAREVMSAAHSHRNAARWTVALAVGLRQSEALGLRWSDVDLDNGTLSVRRGLHRVRGQGLIYEEPKADRSRRTLALPAQLVDALRAHRAAQLEERITAGPLWQDHDLVFAQPNGRPIERKSDWRAWKTLLREAGVREIRLHDGRHTAATLLLAEGVHPRVVMEVLGHAQMRTTTDTYSHVLPALGRDAADRMGRALWD
jgi:integrase